MRTNNRCKGSEATSSSVLSSSAVAAIRPANKGADADRVSKIDLGPIGNKISVKPRETCDALSIGVTKLYELLNSGELTSYREGSRRRILVASIRAYIERRIATAQSKNGA
jgi:excisionase family DNA binding protein